MKKIKICDVVTNSIWYDPRVTRQIDQYKSKKEFDLCCVGRIDEKYSKEKIDELNCLVELIDVPKKYYRANRTFLTKLCRTFFIFKSIRKKIINYRPDIIHANDLDALVPAYLAAKKQKCRLIYDTHEIFLENNNIANNKLIKRFWYFFEKRIIKKVDLVVCVSNASADYLSEKYKIKKPIVITNCMLKKNIPPHDVTIQKNTFDVLNHGQFYFGRGYDTMLDCAKIMKDYEDVKFVLRGYGVIKESLEQRKMDEKLDNVFFDKPVHVNELSKYASLADVGVAITIPYCLNFKLSVSNKLFEYAAAGLPVIMSNIPEHNYLNNLYHFGIVLKDNTPEELKEAILLLKNNKALYKECAYNSIKMTEQINWDKQFGDFIDIELKLASSKKNER